MLRSLAFKADYLRLITIPSINSTNKKMEEYS